MSEEQAHTPPPLLSLTGDQARDLLLVERLWSETMRAGPRINGWPIRFDGTPGPFGIPNACWHMASKDVRGGGREYNVMRARRVAWACWMFANPNVDCITTWLAIERRRRRLYLWMQEYDYVLVLEERAEAGCYYVVTAYAVEGKSSVRKLQTSLCNRIE